MARAARPTGRAQRRGGNAPASSNPFFTPSNGLTAPGNSGPMFSWRIWWLKFLCEPAPPVPPNAAACIGTTPPPRPKRPGFGRNATIPAICNARQCTHTRTHVAKPSYPAAAHAGKQAHLADAKHALHNATRRVIVGPLPSRLLTHEHRRHERLLRDVRLGLRVRVAARVPDVHVQL